MSEKTKEEKKNEKILKKLISEEWIASNFYEQMIYACVPEERDVICDIFLKNRDDEKNDHYAKLIDFCIENGFDVPCKMSDYEMYADENIVKQFDKWSKGKNAGYYIEQAIKSEEDAVKSYLEVLNDESVFDCIKRLVLEFYYDELEHLGNLNSLLIAYNVSAKINL
jgi:ferritin-like protein